MENTCVIQTAIGIIEIEEDEKGICRMDFCRRKTLKKPVTDLLKKAEQQLKDYMDGKRKSFDLPLSLHGTAFQIDVWKRLLQIPYGKTQSYGQIAAAVGKPNAARAIGNAVHNNPIAIIVPCHRVIGTDGSMTGYAAGISYKKKLLAIEKAGV